MSLHSGIKNILRVLGTCLFLWLGGKYLLPLCFPFLLGTALALAAEPAVRLLCRRLHFPRVLAAGIGVTAAYLGITMLTILILAFLVKELGALAGILPDLTQAAQSGMQLLQNYMVDMTQRMPQSVRPLLQQNVNTLLSGGTALLDKAFSWVLGLAGAILSHVPDSALNFGTAIISGYMISVRLPRIRSWLLSRFSREKLQAVRKTLKQLHSVAVGWILAQLRLTAVTFAVLVLGLLILRIPYSILWAAGICLLDALPVLGTGTVLLPWGFISYLQGNRARAAGLIGIYAVVFLTRSILEPKLVGSQLGLDPLVTLFALYAGYRLWGVAGMIIAPLLAVMVTQFFPENRKKQ